MGIQRNLRYLQSIAANPEAKDADRIRAACYLIEYHKQESANQEGVAEQKEEASSVVVPLVSMRPNK